MSLCSWSQLALDDFLGFAVSAQIIPYVHFYHYHPLISVLLLWYLLSSPWLSSAHYFPASGEQYHSRHSPTSWPACTLSVL